MPFRATSPPPRASLLALLWSHGALLAGGVASAQPGPVPAMAPPVTDVEADAMGRRLQVVLRAHGSDIYGCYDKAQVAAGKPLAGEILMRLWVAPGGGVSRVDMLKDEVGSVR